MLTWRSRRGWATTRPRSSRSWCTRCLGGARGAPAPRFWTARSSRSTPTASPRVFSTRIQDRIHLTDAREIVARASTNPIAFVAFDLLRDGDADLYPLPLVERRRRLKLALAPALDDAIRLSKQVRGDGAALLAEARARGWEGLVVKDAGSPYRPGRRSPEWRKFKLVKRDTFVIGGFTEPRGARIGSGR